MSPIRVSTGSIYNQGGGFKSSIDGTKSRAQQCNKEPNLLVQSKSKFYDLLKKELQGLVVLVKEVEESPQVVIPESMTKLLQEFLNISDK